MTKDLDLKKIKRALISVFHKDGIEEIAKELIKEGVEILSTGGTYEFLKKLDIPVIAVEKLTGYPSIFGGRVKTLHPIIFGGILYNREIESHVKESEEFNIPPIDLVIVDLYPFEETVAAGASKAEIIEKIDIGGIALIRAAAKNCNDVVIVPCKEAYPQLISMLKDKKCQSNMEDRLSFASQAFLTSSHYDTMIFDYFNRETKFNVFDKSITEANHLRYGENPHQNALFYGDEKALPKQIHGKEISYNNMLDIESALELISDFTETTVAIIKHTNACGCAVRDTLLEAWKDALAGDPVSAFGGIIITNRKVDLATAQEINNIFFEVIIAPDYEEDALEILKSKKNRRIMINEGTKIPNVKYRSLLTGVLVQDRDTLVEKPSDLQTVTKLAPTNKQIADLIFANILVKHSKSNAIVLAKDKMLIASGIGQTSRVDALKQAVEKASSFKHSLKGAVMSSDAFFPFPDCVEIADKAGITSVIHPGGSIRDQESVDYCNSHEMAMVISGKRHFKH